MQDERTRRRRREKMCGVTIRRIRGEEWQELRALRLRALAHDPYAFAASLEDERAKPDEWWKEWAEEDARSDRWATFVAEEQGSWIGLVACYRDDRDAQAGTIVAMWVEPAARRSGVGLALLDVVEEWLIERGVRELRLSVSNVNEAAHSLYAKRGYEPTGDTARLQSDPTLTEIKLRRIAAADERR